MINLQPANQLRKLLRIDGAQWTARAPLQSRSHPAVFLIAIMLSVAVAVVVVLSLLIAVADFLPLGTGTDATRGLF